MDRRAPWPDGLLHNRRGSRHVSVVVTPEQGSPRHGSLRGKIGHPR
jgi:hypothetical protein